MIVFNALQTSLNGGIGRYSYELAKELYETNNNDIKLVIREEDLEKFSFVKEEDLVIAKNIKNSKERNIYEQFKLPKIINKKYPNAIIHYPDTMAPLLAKNPVVITVHDLAFKSVSGAFTWKQGIWKNIVTDLSIKKAKKIIAITKFTKTEIEKHYPKVDSSKVSVIYNGFNDFSNEDIDKDKIGCKIKDLNKPYILTVSTISPRKNIDGLIKAFNEIKDKVEENLVIAGGNGWMYEQVYSLVDELNLGDRVKFTGRINDEELKWLYKNTKVFAYISFYEGFGLPPLEAKTYDVPCLVSNKASLPEVVGENAMLVEPSDINMISQGLLEILNGNKINIDKKYLTKFSWRKCAKDLKKVYLKINNN